MQLIENEMNIMSLEFLGRDNSEAYLTCNCRCGWLPSGWGWWDIFPTFSS